MILASLYLNGRLQSFVFLFFFLIQNLIKMAVFQWLLYQEKKITSVQDKDIGVGTLDMFSWGVFFSRYAKKIFCCTCPT